MQIGKRFREEEKDFLFSILASRNVNINQTKGTSVTRKKKPKIYNAKEASREVYLINNQNEIYWNFVKITMSLYIHIYKSVSTYMCVNICNSNVVSFAISFHSFVIFFFYLFSHSFKLHRSGIITPLIYNLSATVANNIFTFKSYLCLVF